MQALHNNHRIPTVTLPNILTTNSRINNVIHGTVCEQAGWAESRLYERPAFQRPSQSSAQLTWHENGHRRRAPVCTWSLERASSGLLGLQVPHTLVTTEVTSMSNSKSLIMQVFNNPMMTTTMMIIILLLILIYHSTFQRSSLSSDSHLAL